MTKGAEVSRGSARHFSSFPGELRLHDDGYVISLEGVEMRNVRFDVSGFLSHEIQKANPHRICS